MRNRLAKLALPALLISASSVMYAQDQSSITGVVTDASGAVLPGTTVVLTNPLTGVKYTVKTNNAGSYRFPIVPPGNGYVVTFTHDGFSSTQVSGMALQVGTPRTQDAKLLAGANQQVEVTAGNANVTINTTDATIGNNIDPELLNNLPVQSRTSPASLFTLQPGVVNGAVTGARTDQSSVTIDGLDANDIAAGNGLSGIVGQAPVDAIDQFKGTVGGLTAAQGTGSGGQFQLVTKGGTNKFHGDINEYHRDTATVANTWFNNRNALPRTPLIRNQFGGAIGGPILKNKLFFFFDFNTDRQIYSSTANRTVPLDSYRNGILQYINNGNGCGASSRQNTTPTCISQLSGTQVATLDPLGIGFDQPVLSFVNTRYPHANDLTGGDGVNTGNYSFTTPTPSFTYNYVGRVDYNLTSKMQVFARFSIVRRDSTQTVIQLPTDPVTNPFQDRSYQFVVGHTWQIGSNKVNQFYTGNVVTKYNFATLYNPLGIEQLSLSGLSGPYNSGGSQKRRVPIPVIRDDFNWTLGKHTVAFGGSFKWIKTNSNLVNDFDFLGTGLGGLTPNLNASLRPANVSTNTTAQGLYDGSFAGALGHIPSVTSNYNYNNNGTALTQGSGETRHYRFFQTELYVGDTWKVTPELTLSYGARWQIYSVPYETTGAESVQQFSFNQYFTARVNQSAAGISGDSALPFVTYVLGGKANNGPDMYQMSWKDVAPRFAFVYNPSFNKKMVINGGAGVDYDRTVVNAANFVQDQSSYLFQASASTSYGQTDPVAALRTDPRLGANLSYKSPNTPPVITKPYTPFVDASGSPYGLAENEFNYVLDPALKTPYSITYNFGIQQELPQHMVMKLNYVGRLGRRLIAQEDASQLIDFPDKVSGQSLSAAISNLETQTRNGQTYRNTTPVPWFENVMTPGIGRAYGFASNSAFLNYEVNSLLKRGDFADIMQFIGGNGLMPSNIALPSQFAGNTYLGNMGFSNYNGLLATLQKNLSQGLQFDVNYTWSHSIDNTSQVTNSIASSSGYGYICDVLRPRNCRANADFDVTNAVNANVIYTLPIGRGKMFGAHMNRALDEAVGGWQISAIPTWRSGLAENVFTDAYIAGYANNAPAIFNGNKSAVRTVVNKQGNTLYQFANPAAAQAAFSYPTGFNIGSRNVLRGPGAFTMDAGLAKAFPIVDRVDLKFRADFFNIMNHPAFQYGGNDIDSSTFGVITGYTTDSSVTSSNTYRVGQFSLRLEF